MKWTIGILTVNNTNIIIQTIIITIIKCTFYNLFDNYLMCIKLIEE